MDEADKRRWEDRLATFRKVSTARRKEQDRIIDRIDQLIYEAKTDETVQALVNLAGHILVPVPTK